MKRLFTIDLQDYDKDGTRVYRPSVRGIIFAKDGKIALVHSKNHHYYKFPGGGIEKGENHIDALVREVKEEVGLIVIPASIKEYGNVLRVQKGNEGPNIVFEQENFYYICEVEKVTGIQNLDAYEEEAQFELQYVTLDEAIMENASYRCDDLFAQIMIDRDRRVLELIRNTRDKAGVFLW